MVTNKSLKPCFCANTVNALPKPHSILLLRQYDYESTTVDTSSSRDDHDFRTREGVKSLEQRCVSRRPLNITWYAMIGGIIEQHSLGHVTASNCKHHRAPERVRTENTEQKRIQVSVCE